MNRLDAFRMEVESCTEFSPKHHLQAFPALAEILGKAQKNVIESVLLNRFWLGNKMSKFRLVRQRSEESRVCIWAVKKTDHFKVQLQHYELRSYAAGV